MTGYQSKKAAARDKLAQPEQLVIAQAASDKAEGSIYADYYKADAAVQRLQAALAQPEQEPVACIHKGYLYMAHEFMSGIPDGATLLYTTPPQRQPLTESQIIKIINTHTHADDGHDEIWVDGEAIARAIEAAHGIKEKNT
jgi:hypothetical protein